MEVLARYALPALIAITSLGAFVMCILVFRYGMPDHGLPDDGDETETLAHSLNAFRFGHAFAALAFAVAAVLAVGVAIRTPAPIGAPAALPDPVQEAERGPSLTPENASPSPAVTEPPAAAATTTTAEPPRPVEAKPAEPKPAETPRDAKLQDAKPLDVKPQDAKPQVVEPTPRPKPKTPAPAPTATTPQRTVDLPDASRRDDAPRRDEPRGLPERGLPERAPSAPGGGDRDLPPRSGEPRSEGPPTASQDVVHEGASDHASALPAEAVTHRVEATVQGIHVDVRTRRIGGDNLYVVHLADRAGRPLAGADVSLHGRTADGAALIAGAEANGEPGVYRARLARASQPRDLRLRIAESGTRFEVGLGEGVTWE